MSTLCLNVLNNSSHCRLQHIHRMAVQKCFTALICTSEMFSLFVMYILQWQYSCMHTTDNDLCCHCEPNVSLSTFLGTFVQLASKFYRLRDLTKSWLFSQPVLLVYANNILSYNFTDYGQKLLWYSTFSYIPRFISFQRQLYIWLQKLLSTQFTKNMNHCTLS